MNNDDRFARPSRPPAAKRVKPALKRIGDALVHARLHYWRDKHDRFVFPVFLRVEGDCVVAIRSIATQPRIDQLFAGGEPYDVMENLTPPETVTLTPNQWISLGLARRDAPRDAAGEVIADWHCEAAV